MVAVGLSWLLWILEVQKARLYIRSLTREAHPVQETFLWSIWHFLNSFKFDLYTDAPSQPLSSTDSVGYKTQYLRRDDSRPTSLSHQAMDISQFNSIGQNMRYPSVVNIERSVNSRASSLGLTVDHDMNDLRREIANLRRQKQELEKKNLVRDVQLSTLQYVFLPLVTVLF
jgi:hypothetical protein